MRDVPYRLIYLGLGLLAVGFVLLVVAFLPAGDRNDLPDAIEAVSPEPNDAVLRQTELVVDMLVGFEAAITVDGYRLPDRELNYVEATGVYRWRPTEASVIFPEWLTGNHEVSVDWSPLRGYRQPEIAEFGNYTFTFRVQ